jgi:HK97 gp10 family phage protein
VVKVRFEGGQQLAKALADLPKSTSGKIRREALRLAADPVKERAESIAARAPGAPDMADNIVVSNGRSKGVEVSVVVGPNKNARTDDTRGLSFDVQAWFVENGTVDTPAQPFMRPAFSVAIGHLSDISAAIWKSLAQRGVSGRGRSSGGGLT